jgi:hypothetical protein
MSRELDYSDYRTYQNEAIQDTARIEMRLYRILQEAESVCTGYRKKQKEALKNTARNRLRRIIKNQTTPGRHDNQ